MSGVIRFRTESLAWFSFANPRGCVRGSDHASRAVMPRAFPRSLNTHSVLCAFPETGFGFLTTRVKKHKNL